MPCSAHALKRVTSATPSTAASRSSASAASPSLSRPAVPRRHLRLRSQQQDHHGRCPPHRTRSASRRQQHQPQLTARTKPMVSYHRSAFGTRPRHHPAAPSVRPLAPLGATRTNECAPGRSPTVTAASPPTRLPLEADAVAAAERKLDRVREELRTSRAISGITAKLSNSGVADRLLPRPGWRLGARLQTGPVVGLVPAVVELAQRRRWVASRARVPCTHMVSATSSVTPGCTIASMRSSTSSLSWMPSAAR